jgi:hypothetical protein
MQPMFCHDERKKLALILLLAFLAAAPALLWRTIPARDSAQYALLTQEFSRGNFERAFHPSLPPLLTTLGGTLNVLLHDAFLANRLACILLFLLGVPGTYLLARELRGPRVALLAALLFAICPSILDLATSGGVDAGKLALLPWLAWATYRWCGAAGWAWGAAVGCLGGVLSLARGEGFFFAITALCLFALASLRRPHPTDVNRLRRAGSLLFAASVLSLVILPWGLYQKAHTGLFVTHVSHFKIYELFGISDRWPRETIIDENALPQAAIPQQPTALPQAAIPREATATAHVHPESVDLRYFYKGIRWYRNLEQTTKGFFIPYLLLALLGLWRRHGPGEKRPSRGDVIPLAFIALNLAIFFPTSIMTSRYIIATIPLYLAYAAAGLVVAGGLLSRFPPVTPRRLQHLGWAAVLVMTLVCQKELDIFMNPGKYGQQVALRDIGRWIQEHAAELPSQGALPNDSTYHNGRLPIILETDGRLRFYAQADAINLYPFYHYRPEQIVTICRQGKVALVLYDQRMEELSPGFGQYWPQDPAFRPLDGTPDFPGKVAGMRLLAFDPHRLAQTCPQP